MFLSLSGIMPLNSSQPHPSKSVTTKQLLSLFHLFRSYATCTVETVLLTNSNSSFYFSKLKLHVYIATLLGVTWLYRVSLEERSIFWEVTLSIIRSKKSICTCPIPNGFRDRATSLYSTLLTVQTRNTPCPHTSCKVHSRWLWNFRKCITLGKLYQLCHFNSKYRY
jgi:hypothetical protein